RRWPFRPRFATTRATRWSPCAGPSRTAPSARRSAPCVRAARASRCARSRWWKWRARRSRRTRPSISSRWRRIRTSPEMPAAEPAFPSSLRLYVGILDQLAPFGGFGADAFRELLRRAHDREDEARRQEFFLEHRIVEDAPGLRVELGDDVARRALGGGEAVPGAGLVTGQSALLQGRHIRILRQPPGTAEA